MIPNRWKVIGITAVALGSITGAAYAGGVRLNDPSTPVNQPDITLPAQDDATETTIGVESAPDPVDTTISDRSE
ncbi:MAG TPA: hypothetical protein DCR14_09920, partial [Acidimicrobiaceae bacterium]|nr:hypothetical protein [Acidimicrobiaceae bacterium]